MRLQERKKELIKAIKSKSVYSLKKPNRKGRSHLKAQNEMMDYWDKRFERVLGQIKREVRAVIDGKL